MRSVFQRGLSASDQPVAPTRFWLFSCRSGVSVLVGGVAMEDALWTMPLLRYSGGFGRPGAETLQARCPICSTAARTRPGRAVRHGSYTWVGCTALKQP